MVAVKTEEVRQCGSVSGCAGSGRICGLVFWRGSIMVERRLVNMVAFVGDLGCNRLNKMQRGGRSKSERIYSSQDGRTTMIVI